MPTRNACWRRSSSTVGWKPAACTVSGRRPPWTTTCWSTRTRTAGANWPASISSASSNLAAKRNCYFSLADFIAPATSGRPDYLGGFAVTGGIGCDELVRRFEADEDDYNAIMVKVLADRLAEAFAERLHEIARRDCGYGCQESFALGDLIAEKYRGIRPAGGYPSIPDHTEKEQLFELLAVQRQIGMQLTDSYMMWPAGSVSGLYFSHPGSRYFTIGRITRDQVEDYARRKGWKLREAEKWLAPVLGYDAGE